MPDVFTFRKYLRICLAFYFVCSSSVSLRADEKLEGPVLISHGRFCHDILKVTGSPRKAIPGGFDHPESQEIYGVSHREYKSEAGQPFQRLRGKTGTVTDPRPIFRGPHLLLRAREILALPLGTILWSRQGERWFVGGKKLPPDDIYQDYHWGLRPRSFDFDLPLQGARFAVNIPENPTPEQNLALHLIKIGTPEMLEPRFSQEAAEDASRRLLKYISELTNPIAQANKFNALKVRSFYWRFLIESPAEDFFGRLGLAEVYGIAISVYPELFQEASGLSLVDIYKELRLSLTDIDLFQRFKSLKRGVKLKESFDSSRSRGPLILLTQKKIEKMPVGTVVWNPSGEYKIVGVDKKIEDEDFSWGLRPISHEFDTTPLLPKYEVTLPVAKTENDRIALMLIGVATPELLQMKALRKEARRSTREIEQAMAALNSPVRDMESLMVGSLDLKTKEGAKEFWSSLGLWKRFIETFGTTEMFFHNSHTVVDLYLRLRLLT